jgi:hypothetical protein
VSRMARVSRVGGATSSERDVEPLALDRPEVQIVAFTAAVGGKVVAGPCARVRDRYCALSPR